MHCVQFLQTTSSGLYRNRLRIIRPPPRGVKLGGVIICFSSPARGVPLIKNFVMVLSFPVMFRRRTLKKPSFLTEHGLFKYSFVLNYIMPWFISPLIWLDLNTNPSKLQTPGQISVLARFLYVLIFHLDKSHPDHSPSSPLG